MVTIQRSPQGRTKNGSFRLRIGALCCTLVVFIYNILWLADIDVPPSLPSSSAAASSSAMAQQAGWMPFSTDVEDETRHLGDHRARVSETAAEGIQEAPGVVHVTLPKLDLSPPISSVIAAGEHHPQATNIDNNNSNGQKQQQRRRIVLVHVGKTGGETVRNTLQVTCRMRKNPKRRQECEERFRIGNMTVETVLSQHTVGSIHCGDIIPSPSVIASSTTLLWTLRNPVDRAVSWYHYTNPSHCQPIAHHDSKACAVNNTITRNRQRLAYKPKLWATKFFECFPNINMFASSLVSTPKQTTVSVNGNTDDDAENCTELAWRTIRGDTSMASNHLYFNHAFYWNKTVGSIANDNSDNADASIITTTANSIPPDKEIMVVRTEHLWGDLQHLDDFLMRTAIVKGDAQRIDQAELFRQFPNETHGSERHEFRTPVTQVGRQRLCCALVPELKLYVALVQRAVNLAPQERATTISGVMMSCWETARTLEDLMRQCQAAG